MYTARVPGRERIEQAVEVEPPAGRREFQRHGRDLRAEDPRNLLQVRPQRHHLDDALAGVDQQLRDEHQAR
jgi:hypothetical protein